MILKKKFIIGFVLSVALFLQGCNQNWNDHYNTLDLTTEKDKIVSEMEKIPEISKFTEAVKQIDTLTDLLGQNRLYTVFAPVNETFDSIYQALSGNDEILTQFIMYHFIDGKYKYKDFSSGSISTFNKKYLNINISNSNKVILDNNASIIYPDYLSLNGIIQIIDKPLVPIYNLYEFFKYNENFKKFEESINSYTKKDFNMDASTPDSINDNGDIVYDSVFNISNPFLYKGTDIKKALFYGVNQIYVDITNEDLRFTGVIPSNFTEATAVAKESPFLNASISDYDLAGPILVNFIYNTVYSNDEIVSNIRTYHELPEADTSLIQLYFADLLENNLQSSVNLSNGVVYIIDGMEYDLSWLIKDQGNIGTDQKETDYRNNLFTSITYSENIDTVIVSSNNIKTVFYESDDVSGYTNRYNEWVNFEVEGDFFPVDYIVNVRGRNTESGTFKIEADGKEIGQFNFSAAPSGDLDTKFNVIGAVGFSQKKSTTNLKFTFIGTHSGANTGHQYLWIREIKFVPVLD